MQSYKIEFLTPALQEISNVADIHLARVGAKSAKKITDKIFDSIERLRQFPFSCPEFSDNYRMLVIENYICIYRVIDFSVFIYHVVDGRTNYPAILG